MFGGRDARSGIILDGLRINAQLYANIFGDEDGDTFSLTWSPPNGWCGN